MAYTYLIGWSNLDKWYYGVRFKKDCRPEELWVSYFTSSKYVSKFRKENGEPDIIKVRKLFENKEEATAWESKVLRRLGAPKSKRWLNRTDNKIIILDPHPYKGTVGERYTENQRQAISTGTKEAMWESDIREKYLRGLKNRDSCNARRWINDGVKHKRINKEDLQYYLSNGWSEGRLIKRDINSGRFLKEVLFGDSDPNRPIT